MAIDALDAKRERRFRIEVVAMGMGVEHGFRPTALRKHLAIARREINECASVDQNAGETPRLAVLVRPLLPVERARAEKANLESARGG